MEGRPNTLNSTEIETRLLLWRHVRERWRSRPFCGAFSRVGRERRRRRRRRDEKPLEKEGREAYSFVFARPTAHVLRSEISSALQAHDEDLAKGLGVQLL